MHTENLCQSFVLCYNVCCNIPSRHQRAPSPAHYEIRTLVMNQSLSLVIIVEFNVVQLVGYSLCGGLSDSDPPTFSRPSCWPEILANLWYHPRRFCQHLKLRRREMEGILDLDDDSFVNIFRFLSPVDVLACFKVL